MAVIAGRRLNGLDLATLAYVAIASGAVALSFRGDDIPSWPWLLVAHALLALLVALAPRAREDGPVAAFLGDWYPLLLLGALYGEIGVLTLDAGFQNDLAIQRLEEWVFGSQVSYRWIRETANPALSWLLHGCYLAYYAILYASPLGLWMVGRRDASRHTILAVMLTFYLCYVAFLFFPVAGPRYAFDAAQNAATDVAPARFASWLLDHGDSWGAAFPSSHVAASVVATGMALRYWRALGLVLLPFTAGLILAVVYGQFHYAVDALAGLVLAAVMLGVMQAAEAWQPVAISGRRARESGPPPPPPPPPPPAPGRTSGLEPARGE
ncbi:MAG: phosphatase PAP2 family protein [Gemmatimonadales bacterium]